jgi:hypothetical protein
MYLSNPESTNLYIRENLFKDVIYELYFYEIIPEFVTFMVLKV